MNKKGFTLAELLAVIVILALVTTLAFRSFYGIRNNSLENMLKSKITEIESGAELYGQNNQNKLTDCKIEGVESNFCTTVTVGELLDKDYVESNESETTINGEKKKDLLNNVTNKSMRCDIVTIYRKNNRIYATMQDLNSDNKTCEEKIEEKPEGDKYTCTCNN